MQCRFFRDHTKIHVKSLDYFVVLCYNKLITYKKRVQMLKFWTSDVV